MKSRRGHRRSACEVNLVRGQQQEPTESSPLLAMGTSRNPRPLGRGGCQVIDMQAAAILLNIV